jgi:hypothetical protein
MGAVVGVVAAVIALLGVIVALGHVGYLAMLRNAAKDRGASGAATLEYVDGRWKGAAPGWPRRRRWTPPGRSSRTAPDSSRHRGIRVINRGRERIRIVLPSLPFG